MASTNAIKFIKKNGVAKKKILKILSELTSILFCDNNNLTICALPLEQAICKAVWWEIK